MLCWVFATHIMPELMYAAFPVPLPGLVYAIACGTLYPHSHALFGMLSTSHTLVIRSVFVKLVPAVCLQSWCVQHLMPTVCLIIAECSALNTCGIAVICTVLALGVCSAWHTRCARGVGPATADVCSTFSIWCQLWFRVCQTLSNLHRQRFVFKVCLAPVKFGICSVVSARTGPFSVTCSVFWFLWCDQCSQQTSGTVAGAQCQCGMQCLQWARPAAPAACSLCPRTPCLLPQVCMLAACPASSPQYLMRCLLCALQWQPMVWLVQAS